MAKLIARFNANNVDPTQGVGQLPVGRHPVIIVESEVEGTKGGNGGMLTLTLKIIDGPQTGTTGAYRLNLYNQNPQTCQIAERQLSAVCHVTGVLQDFDDTTVLHNKPFLAEVGFQKGHEPGSGPDAKGYTEVKKVFDSNGNEPGKKGVGQQQQQNNGQFDKQIEQDTRRHENNSNGNGNGWGNGGQQQQQNNGGGNGNWGNNGGGQQQPQQTQNQGGTGGGWGNNGGNNQNNGGNSNGNGGGSWQQNANGAQGGGNSNGGWGQRN